VDSTRRSARSARSSSSSPISAPPSRCFPSSSVKTRAPPSATAQFGVRLRPAPARLASPAAGRKWRPRPPSLLQPPLPVPSAVTAAVPERVADTELACDVPPNHCQLHGSPAELGLVGFCGHGATPRISYNGALIRAETDGGATRTSPSGNVRFSGSTPALHPLANAGRYPQPVTTRFPGKSPACGTPFGPTKDGPYEA
jgi:hypothetical protein